ncbi:hypothetical protein GF354_03205 [Candidatus Peregrinibacteria bacterium]|nr:hypothetical protein [Candidatus Peregrinibacteria bacterium]
MNHLCKWGVLSKARQFFALILMVFILMLYNGNYVLAGLFFNDEPTNVWTVSSHQNYPVSYGDEFIVDIENGEGYLINYYTKTFTKFPLMTGTTYAPTPVSEWIVKEKNIQGNRVVFSDSGEFFRMYKNGITRTGYGIHGYKYFKREIENGRKFLSLGCVLVADDVLDVIEESFYANKELFNMSTREKVDLWDLLKRDNEEDPRFFYNL